MKHFLKERFISKLPEMILSAIICSLVGLVIYWLRGVHNAPYVCAVIGFVFPLLRPAIEQRNPFSLLYLVLSSRWRLGLVNLQCLPPFRPG